MNLDEIKRKNLEYWWEEWIKPILIAAVLALLIRTFIIQPFKIPSNSMFPTLQPGDRIFVSKFVYGAKIPFMDVRLPKIHDPKTGDIVVFLSPVEKNKYLVKRFIAHGGQTVEIKDGIILVDGKKVDNGPVTKFTYLNRGDYGEENKAIKVPDNCFFVLGDNSANSMDSRYWGFVPYRNLVGKAFVIHWPVSRLRMLTDKD
ncbi:MAG TPA: signal peptidase I [Candidatus Omnitrophota bacterium]|nr:signal peptidase I [Candidatus Omnitrophota bacterium]